MDIKRVAILPFKNLGDPAYQYLAEGLTESAQSVLRAVSTYLVISKESIQQIKEQDIYEQLQVDVVLKGALAVKEEHIQLTISAFGQHGKQPLWEQILQSELREVLALGNRFVAFLQKQMETGSTKTLKGESKFPQNRQAYRAYLLGEHYLHKWTRAYTELAMAQFEKVIELEPDFIPGYLGYAKASIFLVGRGFKIAEKYYPEVMTMLDRMLLINATYGELYIYKGIIEFFYLLDWESAYRNIERGLKNFSEASEAYSQLSHFWYGMRRYDKAIEAIHIAMEYNPLSISLLNMKGDIQVSSKRYEEAIPTFKSILELQPKDLVALENLMYIYALKGDERMTRKYLHLMQKEGELSVVSFPRIGYVYGKFGKPEEWKTVISTLENLMEKEANAMHLNRLANVYAGLGKWEQVMNYVEKGFAHRTGILFILTDPGLEPIRKWKRFKKLEAEITFPKNLMEENSILIQSDLKKQVELNPERLLYAVSDQNYTTLVQYNNFRLEKTLMRLSIKRLYEQLPASYFFYCHRSYIVNKQLEFEISGNAKGYKLYSKTYDFEVPVSRAKIAEMKVHFELDKKRKWEEKPREN